MSLRPTWSTWVAGQPKLHIETPFQKYILNCLCVCVCRPEESTRSSGAGFTSGCEAPDVGVGNKTWSIVKKKEKNIWSQLLSHLSSPTLVFEAASLTLGSRAYGLALDWWNNKSHGSCLPSAMITSTWDQTHVLTLLCQACVTDQACLPCTLWTSLQGSPWSALFIAGALPLCSTFLLPFTPSLSKIESRLYCNVGAVCLCLCVCVDKNHTYALFFASYLLVWLSAGLSGPCLRFFFFFKCGFCGLSSGLHACTTNSLLTEHFLWLDVLVFFCFFKT